MRYCTNCGKQTDWTNEKGYCRECAKSAPTNRRRTINRAQVGLIAGGAVFLLLVAARGSHNKNVREIDTMAQMFSGAGYIAQTQNAVVYAVASENPKLSDSSKKELSAALLEMYGGSYKDLEQMTILIKSDDGTVWDVWVYHKSGALQSIGGEEALALLNQARSGQEAVNTRPTDISSPDTPPPTKTKMPIPTEPTPTPQPTPVPTPEPTPTPTAKPTPKPASTSTPKSTPSPTPKKTDNGTSSPTPQETPKETSTPSASKKTVGDLSPSEYKGKYVGSSESDKYHYTSCRSAKIILIENAIWWDTEEEAIAMDYKPCGICNP